MSVSKRYVGNEENVKKVISLYLSEAKPTLEDMAVELGTTYHNVQHIVRTRLPKDVQAREKALRYSRAKTLRDVLQPPPSGSRAHHWKGGRTKTKEGYWQVRIGKRYFLEHRLVMEKALGLEPGGLPQIFEVHHIDENKQNNVLDNLALVTPSGHRELHCHLNGWQPASSRSTLWEKWASGTSK